MDETMLFWIASNRHERDFPPISEALTEPDGLLAAAGDLSVSRLLKAYRQAIFPWYDESQPILWWSPNPRTVLKPGQAHISRSLAKHMRKHPLTISFNQAFEQVITECAVPRSTDEGTWITPEMKAAYITLHKEGHAHSIECWQNDVLVGGLYGVAIGKVFFGESMFSRVTNASKVCFVKLSEHLHQWGFELMDCQVESAHLTTMGAHQINRDSFKQQLDIYCEATPAIDSWRLL